jgi:phosphate transport system permease protein
LSDPIATGRSAATGDPGRRAGLPAPSPAPEAGISASTPPSTEPPAETRRTVVQRGDRIFSGLATGSGVFVVVLIGAIGLFLLLQAIPALIHDHANFLTSREFATDDPNALRFGILELLEVTVEVSVYALVLAMPVGLGIALFLTQYAPARVARPLAYLVDLLAAVPSIIFGLWGILVLAPVIRPVAQWLNAHFGWIWLFAHGNVGPDLGSNLFTAGIVLAAMLLPIITAITREVFQTTDSQLKEGAYALGATRWEMVRMTVLPVSRAGVVGAVILGLGRALGEAIAVTQVIGNVTQIKASLFAPAGTMASWIANGYQSANPGLGQSSLIYLAAILLVISVIVNLGARLIIRRRTGTR